VQSVHIRKGKLKIYKPNNWARNKKPAQRPTKRNPTKRNPKSSLKLECE